MLVKIIEKKGEKTSLGSIIYKDNGSDRDFGRFGSIVNALKRRSGSWEKSQHDLKDLLKDIVVASEEDILSPEEIIFIIETKDKRYRRGFIKFCSTTINHQTRKGVQKTPLPGFSVYVSSYEVFYFFEKRFHMKRKIFGGIIKK